MTIRDLLRRLIISWDCMLALFIVLITSYLIPEGTSIIYVKDLYSTSISVLAIIFSVYLASLAVLITAGDNEFVRFLEEDGSYTKIVSTFKLTLSLLSLSLVISVVLYAIVLRLAEYEPQIAFPRCILLSSSFLGLYSLLATIQSSLDMLKYAEFRARFLNTTRPTKEE